MYPACYWQATGFEESHVTWQYLATLVCGSGRTTRNEISDLFDFVAGSFRTLRPLPKRIVSTIH